MRNSNKQYFKKITSLGKTKIPFLFFLCSLLIFNCYLAIAFDFGLLLNQYAGLGGEGHDTSFEYKGGIVPRIAFPAGENGEVFISASFTIGADNDFYYYPELLRTEYNMQTGNWGFRAGRIGYNDPSGYIAQGLFDGFHLTNTSAAGRFSLAAAYTGFIFKKNANIRMTDADRDMYDLELDYSDFFNTYFGSRRLLAAFDWEHPAVAELLRLKVSFLGQFDLNGEDKKLSSQYLVFKMGLPVNSLYFEAGGIFSMMQREDAGNSFFEMAFGIDLGVNWILPASFYSRLSLFGYYTSGKINNNSNFAPFSSLNTFYVGNVLQPKRTALTAISLDYSARLADSLGLGVTAFYFVRNDNVTGEFSVNGTEDTTAFFLGPEIFLRLVWSPVSDVQINFGGGAFFPSLGNVWADASVKWKIELTAILAIF